MNDEILEVTASPAPEESTSPEPEEEASSSPEESASPEPIEVIDYERLTTSIQEAVSPAPDISANINDLPLSDVLLLLVALVLGILVVKGRSS